MMLLCASVLACYLQVVTHEFVNFDDGMYVATSPQVQAGLSVHGAVWAWNTWCAANWHPLTWITYMAEMSVWGPKPGLFALTNAVVHCVNAILLFWLLIKATRLRWASAAIAALFALHPLNAESVAWISQLKSVFCVAFTLGALICWVNWTQRRQFRWYVATAVLFGVGLLFKPIFVTFAAILLLFDLWPLSRWQWKGVRSDWAGLWALSREKLPFFLVVLPYSFVTAVAQAAGGAFLPVSRGDAVGNAATSYWVYIRQALVPEGLSIVYPFTGSSAVAIGAALIGLISLTIIAIRKAERSPWIAVGWLFYLGTFVPMIGILQVGFQSHADRYFYVPGIGLFIAVVIGSEMAAHGRAFRRYLISGFIAVCAVLTFIQVGCWKNSETLFRQALAHHRENPSVLSNLAGTLFNNALSEELDVRTPGGGVTPAGRAMLNESDALRREALRLPFAPRALIFLGSAYSERFNGNQEKCLYWLDLAIKEDAAVHTKAYFLQAVIFNERGLHKEALAALINSWAAVGRSTEPYSQPAYENYLRPVIGELRRAIEDNPNDGDAWLLLSHALALTDEEGSSAAAASALRIAPHLKGRTLAFDAIREVRAGRLVEGKALLIEALRVEPSNEAAINSLRFVERALSPTFQDRPNMNETIWTLVARKLSRYKL
jgi:tetratricopeptide (TPR) repeat protein